jgi:tetrachlorobenzoquinone reductase
VTNEVEDIARSTFAAPDGGARQTGIEAGTAANKTLQVRVRGVTWEAAGVVSLQLASPDDSALPAFTPGAHIDLHLPDGTIRQYSLCGDTDDTLQYRVGIREIGGGHASQFIHRKLRPGELLTISPPRNNFPLVGASRYLFIAGGIGVTPLIPMMRAADKCSTPWSLLYCNRRPGDAPFLKEIMSFRGNVVLHTSETGTRLDVERGLGTPQPDTIVYCCGPERLMAAVEAATAAWPEDSVRFEWFAPRSRPDDEASGVFEVTCERSNVTLSVPPDKSVLAVLTEAGIEIPRSCEQGICGTCEVRVLAGEIEHRDSILSASERAANNTMMTCVSRARSPRLVLDL